MVFSASIVSRISVCGVKELKTRLVFSEVGHAPKAMVGVAKTRAFDWTVVAYVSCDADRRYRNHRIPKICVSRNRVTKPLVNRACIPRRNWLGSFTNGDIVSFSTQSTRDA